MKKYQVQIARTETTVYFVDVVASDEDTAKELAYERFNDNDYDDSKVVYGEEFTHDIEVQE
jgi:hypothetical protein